MDLISKLMCIVLLVLVAASVYILFSPFLLKKNGVVVSILDDKSQCGDIKNGDVITQVGGFYIKNSNEFKNAVSDVKINEYVPMVVNDGPGGCVAINDGNVGISVEDVKSKYLKFSSEIGGGTTYSFALGDASKIDKTKTIIEKRIKFFNLPGTKVYASGSNLKIDTIYDDKIGYLTKIGIFEVKILEDVKLTDSSGNIPVGNNSYEFNINNGTIAVGGSSYELNRDFVLDKINFRVVNVTNISAIVSADIFNDLDVIKVLSANSYTTYQVDSSLYEYVIPIELSVNASNRFSEVTRKMGTTFVPGSSPVLDGVIVYYLDGKQINRLNIPTDLAGKDLNGIIGFNKNIAYANDERLLLESSMMFGRIPTELSLIGSNRFEGSMKNVVFYQLPIAAVVILFVFFGISYMRYKNIKLSGLILLLAISEVLVISGIILMIQNFLNYQIVFDLISFIGLASIMLITIVELFLINEKMIKKKEFNISYKYKKIFDAPRLLDIVVLVFGFAVLFTTWKNIGSILILGIIFDILLMKIIYRNFLK